MSGDLCRDCEDLWSGELGDGIMDTNEGRPGVTGGRLLWAVCAVCVGLLCLWQYHQPQVGQHVLREVLPRVAHTLEKYSYSHSAEVYEMQALHYLGVLFWLLPAWLFLVLGLSVVAPLVWRRSVTNWIRRHSGWIVMTLAAAAFVCSLIFSTFVVEREPITQGDEYCYAFQAKLFASGRLHTTEGANMEEFSNSSITTTGPRRYAIGFPGHPLILLLGMLAGDMRLVPPLMAAISVGLVYLIAKSLFSRGTAIIAAGLLATSPFYLSFHGTLLPQSSLLPFLLLFLLCAIRMADNWKWYWLLFGAIALTLATLIRPPSVVLFAGPIGCYLLLQRTLPLRRRALIGVVCLIAVLVGTLALCVYSSLTSGQPLSLTLAPRAPGELPYSIGLGFHNQLGHTPLKGLANTAKMLVGWNYYLFGWPISFLPVIVWVIKRGKSGWEYVFIVSVISYYSFYFSFYGPAWHYYLDTVPLLAIVSACAINRCCTRYPVGVQNTKLRAAHYCDGSTRGPDKEWSRDTPPIAMSEVARAPHGLHMLFLVGLMLSSFSWPSLCSYFRGRAAHTGRVSKAICDAGVKNAVVLLDDLPDKDMYSAIGRNSPDLDDDIVLAKKLADTQWRRTVAMFPDRAVWVLRNDGNNGLVCSRFQGEIP
jgi:hypothetical protein